MAVNNQENRIPVIPKPSNQERRRGSLGHAQNLPVLIMRAVNERLVREIMITTATTTFSMMKEFDLTKVELMQTVK